MTARPASSGLPIHFNDALYGPPRLFSHPDHTLLAAAQVLNKTSHRLDETLTLILTLAAFHVTRDVARKCLLTLNEAANKLVIKAKQNALNLQSGANQIVVVSNGVRSNAFTLTL